MKTTKRRLMELANIAVSTEKVDAKIIADKMRNDQSADGKKFRLASFADKVSRMGSVSEKDLDEMLPDYIPGNLIASLFSEPLMEFAAIKTKKRSLREAKSNIKTTWKTTEDLEADLQDWLSGKSGSEVQDVLDTLQNFVDNYEGEMDMEDDF